MTVTVFRLAILLMIGPVPLGLATAAPAPAPPAKATRVFQAPGRIHRMAASPNGKYVAIALGGGPVVLLDAQTGRSLGRLPGTPPEEPQSLAFSPDSGTFAAGFIQGKYFLWNTARPAPPRTINGEGFSGSGVAFTPDGKTLKTYTTAGIRCWDRATGAKRMAVELTGPGSSETSSAAAYSADATTLAIPGGLDTNHTIYLWDTTTGKLRTQVKQEKLVQRLSLSAKGERLIFGDNADVVRVWDVATGRLVRSWKLTGLLDAVAISADGNLAAFSTDSDPLVHVWDLTSGRMVAQFPGHTEGAHDLLFAPGGRHLYTAAGRTARLWTLPPTVERRAAVGSSTGGIPAP